MDKPNIPDELNDYLNRMIGLQLFNLAFDITYTPIGINQMYNIAMDIKYMIYFINIRTLVENLSAKLEIRWAPRGE